MEIFCKTSSILGFEICKQKSNSILANNFISHLSEYGISYGTQDEFDFRFQIFQQKDAKI